jgi:predicted transcriptional regulator
MNLPEDFSDRLKQAMQTRGIRAVDICTKHSFEKSHLSHIMAGHRLPDFSTLHLLIEALQPIDANWLITGKFLRSAKI